MWEEGHTDGERGRSVGEELVSDVRAWVERGGECEFGAEGARMVLKDFLHSLGTESSQTQFPHPGALSIFPPLNEPPSLPRMERTPSLTTADNLAHNERRLSLGVVLDITHDLRLIFLRCCLERLEALPFQHALCAVAAGRVEPVGDVSQSCPVETQNHAVELVTRREWGFGMEILIAGERWHGVGLGTC